MPEKMRNSTAACCPYDLQAVQQMDFFGFSIDSGYIILPSDETAVYYFHT